MYTTVLCNFQAGELTTEVNNESDTEIPVGNAETVTVHMSSDTLVDFHPSGREENILTACSNQVLLQK